MEVPLFKCSRCDSTFSVHVIANMLETYEVEYHVFCNICNWTKAFSPNEISSFKNVPIGFRLNNLEVGERFQYFQ